MRAIACCSNPKKCNAEMQACVNNAWKWNYTEWCRVINVCLLNPFCCFGHFEWKQDITINRLNVSRNSGAPLNVRGVPVSGLSCVGLTERFASSSVLSIRSLRSQFGLHLWASRLLKGTSEVEWCVREGNDVIWVNNRVNRRAEKKNENMKHYGNDFSSNGSKK